MVGYVSGSSPAVPLRGASSEGNIGLEPVCPTDCEPVVRFRGKQAGMPVWRTDSEVYVPSQAVRVIRGLESCFVLAVMDSA
jgi:hypothetical protein